MFQLQIQSLQQWEEQVSPGQNEMFGCISPWPCRRETALTDAGRRPSSRLPARLVSSRGSSFEAAPASTRSFPPLPIPEPAEHCPRASDFPSLRAPRGFSQKLQS